MPLTDDQIRAIAVQLVQEDPGQTLGRSVLTKQDLMAAVKAVDDYLDENPAGEVQQVPLADILPQPFKDNSPPLQRAAVLTVCLLARVGT